MAQSRVRVRQCVRVRVSVSAHTIVPVKRSLVVVWLNAADVVGVAGAQSLHEGTAGGLDTDREEEEGIERKRKAYTEREKGE